IPAEELRVGDRFIVRPGEAIPTDGIIRKGRGSINEASITGESVPVQKGEGDPVFAGTLNETGALEIEATREFADNTVSRIIHMVEEAQEEKGRSQRLIDQFGRRYSPAVLGAGLLIAVLPPALGASWSDWIIRATVFVVSAAPCALVISVPITIVAAIGTASRRGVLIKGGIYVEQLAQTRAVCFDKTGTLTRGRPQVTDILPMNGMDENTLLSLAASAELRSEHPLARAVVQRARLDGLSPTEPDAFEAIPGAGLSADIDGRRLYVVRPDYLQQLRQSLPDAAATTIHRLQSEGKTVVAVAEPGRLLGLLAIRDEVRPNAAEALARLHRIGLKKLIMLTGDNAGTAQAIARELGLDEVHAELRPEDKAKKVQELRQRYGNVAMVGDGINDAPALAAATVGIAMGAAGTDVALETADVALMADNLGKLPEVFLMSRKARRIIRQNLGLSVAVISVLVVGALTGTLSLPLAVLGHELSEFAVIGNGLRMVRG
ncbi:MAG: cation-translocating P-type ATPase, partial [candidate division KSB1 bacterium]|nr:cation-translocating P-type ATPase [candidate division KSB1 bacterium]